MVKQPPSHRMQLLTCFLLKKAALTVPTPWDCKHHFFLMSVLQALSARHSCSQLLGGAVHFSEENNHFFSRTFSVGIFLLGLLAFASKLRDFQCPPQFLHPKLGVCGWLSGEVFVNAAHLLIPFGR